MIARHLEVLPNMSQSSRNSFAYAPLRTQVTGIRKAALEIEPLWWHDQLSRKSLRLFDLVSCIGFSVAGLLLTWTARNWAPSSLWSYHWANQGLTLSAVRVGLVGLVTALAFAGILIGNRLHILDLPTEEKFWTPFKLLATALLAWGCFFVYHDDILGVIPMGGLTLISLMILFRVELGDAMKMAAYLAMIGAPVVLSGWLV